MPLASTIDLPDRYRVVRHIASGGMASVWEAEDMLLGRIVAVKVLAAHYAADAGARARFQREARTAAQVSGQTHVVTIYDIGEHGDEAFIVMEHFAGGTVADRLRAARDAGSAVPRSTALRWLREAAAGLDVAHAAGIVHRDVKPANLLLDARDRLAVGDFGIARLADDTHMTQTGQVLGTAAYLSPEQALGRPATAASDRYALAVVAYELLTGSRPFAGGPPTAQARQHAEAVPPPASAIAPDLPAALDAVLARGLAKDPAERPRSAGALVSAIASALGQLPATEPTHRMEPGPAAAAAGAGAAGAEGAGRSDGARPAAPEAPPAALTPPAAAIAAAAAAAATPPAPASTPAAATPAAERARAAPTPAAATPPAEPAAAPPGPGDAGRSAERAAAASPRAPTPPPADTAPPAAAGPPSKPAVPATAPADATPPGRPAAAVRRRAPELAAATLLAAGTVALVLILTSGGGERQTGAATAPSRTTAAAPQPPPQPPPPPAAEPSASASTLNDQGFALIQRGRYAEAVAPLRASVESYRSSGTSGLPYAYAIYNLAVALNRSGDPAEAVPLLRERLKFDNQRGTVQKELDDALAKLGETSSQTGKGDAKKKKAERGDGDDD